MLVSLLLLSFCIAVSVLAQLYIYRNMLRKSLYWSIFGGILIGFAVLVIAGTQIVGLKSSVFWANVAIYLCFGYIYFHFNNMGETARRIRILIELFNARRPMSQSELIIRYDSEEIVNRRLRRMVSAGQILDRNGRFYLGNRSFLVMARIIQRARTILWGRGARAQSW